MSNNYKIIKKGKFIEWLFNDTPAQKQKNFFK